MLILDSLLEMHECFKDLSDFSKFMFLFKPV